MSESDRKFLSNLEKDLQKVYWKICKGESNGAGEIQALALEVAIHLGY